MALSLWNATFWWRSETIPGEYSIRVTVNALRSFPDKRRGNNLGMWANAFIADQETCYIPRGETASVLRAESLFSIAAKRQLRRHEIVFFNLPSKAEPYLVWMLIRPYLLKILKTYRNRLFPMLELRLMQHRSRIGYRCRWHDATHHSGRADHGVYSVYFL